MEVTYANLSRGKQTGDSGGKEDEGQAHAGQYTVYAQGFRIVQAMGHQTVGNIDGLYALQQIDHQTVGR